MAISIRYITLARRPLQTYLSKRIKVTTCCLQVRNYGHRQQFYSTLIHETSTNNVATPSPKTPSTFQNSQQPNKLIEIERKFKLRDSDLQTIKQIARFRGEKKYDDEYYDTPDYKLTKQDTWLRKRNGTWECKVAVDNGSNKGTDYYLELTNETDILKYLLENKIIANIDPTIPLEAHLVGANVSKFASVCSTRSKYSTDIFTFDLDITDFGYSIGEIEIMVKDATEIPLAQKQIDEFVEKHSLVVSGVQGKVLEYLSRFRKDHYNALVGAGLISRKIS